MFILFDGRAQLGNPDDASILLVVRTEEEARKEGPDYEGMDCIWYQEMPDDTLKARWDLPPRSIKEGANAVTGGADHP